MLAPRPSGRGTMPVVRQPEPALRPYIDLLWATEAPRGVSLYAGVVEHVLPTGRMHLAIRLCDSPLLVRPSPEDRGVLLTGAVVGGPRPRYFVRETAAPSCSVAAVLRPGVDAALRLLESGSAVHVAERASGLAGRQMIAAVRRATGLAPKAYQRVFRFQRALRGLRRGEALASVAAGAGFSDQAHFSREFLAFSGVTPAAYRERRPAHANHLPVGQISSRRDRDGRR